MGRGNTSFEKRRREKEKREKKEMKRARRDEKNASTDEPVETESNDELMAQFAELGRKHAAGEINDVELKDSRNEIFEKLGLPVD